MPVRSRCQVIAIALEPHRRNCRAAISIVVILSSSQRCRHAVVASTVTCEA